MASQVHCISSSSDSDDDDNRLPDLATRALAKLHQSTPSGDDEVSIIETNSPCWEPPATSPALLKDVYERIESALKTPPRTAAAAKKKQVEDRKAERARLKTMKEQQKKKEKELKELEKLAKQAKNPAECFKFIRLHITASLCSSEAGSHLASTVMASDAQHKLVDSDSMSKTISFYRLDPMTNQEVRQDHAIVVLYADEILSRLDRNDNGRLELSTYLRNYADLLKVQRLHLFVWKLDETIQERRYASGRAATRVRVEEILAEVQLINSIDSKLFSDAQELADYVIHIAKAVAQAPYKRAMLEDGGMFSWYVEGSNTSTVKVTADGVGLKRLWVQQLRQFTSVGLETAQAIAQAYPAPALLIQAYNQCSPLEGASLLADIPVRRGTGPLQTQRRVGPELSKKVYTLFCSAEPHKVLGS